MLNHVFKASQDRVHGFLTCGPVEINKVAKATREEVDTWSLVGHLSIHHLIHSQVFAYDGTGSWKPSLNRTSGPQTHYSGSGFLQ